MLFPQVDLYTTEREATKTTSKLSMHCHLRDCRAFRNTGAIAVNAVLQTQSIRFREGQESVSISL
jgi:hypothetical protein